MKKKKIIIISMLVIGFIIMALCLCVFKLLNKNDYSKEKVETVKIYSDEGKEIKASVLKYMQDNNIDSNQYHIQDIIKHTIPIIGDGYDMGTDSEPVVIDIYVNYIITLTDDNNFITLNYDPDLNSIHEE